MRARIQWSVFIYASLYSICTHANCMSGLEDGDEPKKLMKMTHEEHNELVRDQEGPDSVNSEAATRIMNNSC